MAETPEAVVLVDAKNFVHRHHHTHRTLATSGGECTSVLYGCPLGLLGLAKKLPGIPFVFVWDGPGRTWRHELLDPHKTAKLSEVARVKPSTGSLADISARFQTQMVETSTRYLFHQMQIPKEKLPPQPKAEGYKANRTALHASADHIVANQQIPEFRRLLDHLGIRSFEVHGLEGDDLIGVLTNEILEKRYFETVIIHSTDRDFYQFIGNRVKVLKYQKEGALVWAHREDIEREFGIPIGKWTEFRAITGDSGDNIPQLIPFVGPKTAAKFLHDGVDASIEQFALARTNRIVRVRGQDYDLQVLWPNLRRNYHLCRVVTDWKDDRLPAGVSKDLQRLQHALGMKSFLRRQDYKSEDWQWVTDWMVKYEMSELMARRQELWSLP